MVFFAAVQIIADETENQAEDGEHVEPQFMIGENGEYLTTGDDSHDEASGAEGQGGSFDSGELQQSDEVSSQSHDVESQSQEAEEMNGTESGINMSELFNL